MIVKYRFILKYKIIVVKVFVIKLFGTIYPKEYDFQKIAQIIRVCIYRLVVISIDLSETVHFAHWKSETISETIFF